MILVLLFYVSTTRFDQVNMLAILEFHLSAAKKKNIACRNLLKKSTIWSYPLSGALLKALSTYYFL